MKDSQFKKLLSKIQELTLTQAEEIRGALEKHLQKESAQKFEIDFSELQCPYCHSSEIGHWGCRNGLRRYRCKSCKKTFNSLTGTSLARLRKKELWKDYEKGMQSGETLQQTADRLHISKSTAIKWKNRFSSKPEKTEPQNQAENIVQENAAYQE